MKKTRVWTIIALALAAKFGAAEVRSYLRFNDYSLTFTDSSTFGDANFKGSVAINTVADAPGDKRNGVTWQLPVGARFDSWTGFGNLQVNNVTHLADGTVKGDLLATTAGNGYYLLDFGIDHPNTTTVLTRDGSGIRWKLRLNLDLRGGLDDGKPYYYQLKLPGDWSAVGQGQGQHTATYNSLWTVDNNFVFDGANTLFNAHLPSYTGDGNHDLNLDVTLYGAPVETVLSPTNLIVSLGAVSNGNVESLSQDDGNTLKICKAFIPNQNSPRIQFSTDFQSPILTPSSVKLFVKGRMTTGGVFALRGYVADRTGGGYTYGAANEAIPLATINLTANVFSGTSPQPSKNVHTDGTVRARVEIQQTGFSAVAVPCSEFDFVNVHVSP